MRVRVAFAAGLAALCLPGGAHAAVQELVLRSQALQLKPYGVAQGVIAVPSPNVDGYVTGMNVEVIDTSGRVQTPFDVMLHHAVFVKALAPDYTCNRFLDFDGRPSPIAAERFFGAGEEHMELALPAGYGYSNRGSDVWALVYMLMNHRNAPATVHVQYRVRYTTGEQLTAVRPIWLDVANCRADPIFTVPGTGATGSTFTRTTDFTMPESGRLVAGGAHLHGGGIRLELRNRSCGDRAQFTSRPTWSATHPMPTMHEPGPIHMTSFADAGGIPVAAGETLRLRAVYDGSRPHMRVMGIMIAYLAPGAVARCADAPDLDASAPGGDRPPHVHQPLLRRPRGALARVRSTSVGEYRFGAERVLLAPGDRFRWRFIGAERHDVTLANGPAGFASPSLRTGTFSYRFRRKGTYNLYCTLHPTLMTQQVVVR